MTRLTSADIETIPVHLDDYDRQLNRSLGCSLRDLALNAAGLAVNPEVLKALADVSVAVVPVTGGLGVIGGFADTVATITAHLGMKAFVTEHADVGGIAEGFQSRADLVFLSDDHRFVALCPERREVVDNVDATAVGFATGLSMMTGGIKDRRVLVVGCGPVGIAAASILSKMGARLGLCDRAPERCRRLAERIRETAVETPQCIDAADMDLKRWSCIYDATNSAGVIDRGDLVQEAIVAAPGMPCGVTARARALLGRRLLHDPLQIGVATMAAMGLRILVAGPEGEGA